MAKLISGRYALSLFEAGKELELTEVFYKELELLNGILSSEEQLIKILKYPKIHKEEKKSLMKEILGESVSIELMNFLYILIDKRRETYLIDIIEEYNSLFYNHKGIVKVLAITSIPMDEKSMEKLTVVLENKLNKKIELSNQVDKSIIGGVLLKVENKFMDGTLLNQIKSMDAYIKAMPL